VIDASEPDLIVLAGFMRILGPAFVRRYEGRMINVHPSLLPSYTGLHTHRRALADGVRIHGCTVHFVTGDVDHGPVIAQGAVPVHDGDDEATLAARVLEVEHRLLPAAVRAFCEGRLVIAGRQVCVNGQSTPAATLEVPAPSHEPVVPAKSLPPTRSGAGTQRLSSNVTGPPRTRGPRG
jgi:phosphoribosylglycinamide formyltransferase-1